MYGQAGVAFPRRVVCLSADTAEIAFLVGAGERVVGVPGTARRPEAARERARVGGFTTFRLDRILALEPDLVLAFSDLQRGIVSDLIGAGVSVLCTNPRSFDEVLGAILLVGGALGCEAGARALVEDMTDEARQIREYSSGWPDRPRVYFEEWPDPLIAGIRWVSELIEMAGGHDVFAELAGRARQRPGAAWPPTRSCDAIPRSSWPRGAGSPSTSGPSRSGPAGARSPPSGAARSTSWTAPTCSPRAVLDARIASHPRDHPGVPGRPLTALEPVPRVQWRIPLRKSWGLGMGRASIGTRRTS